MGTTIQHIGVGTAVEAARRAIFFVELMRGEEVRSALVTSFPKAAELAARCRTQIDKQVTGFSEAWSFDRDASYLRSELKRLIRMVHPEDIEEPALSEEWHSLQQAVDEATVDDLDWRFTHFIQSARSRFARAVEDAASLAWRNLATLCGISLVTTLVCAVPQIRALVFEHPWYGPVALGTLLPVPIMAIAGIMLGRARARNVPAWLANWTRLGFFWRPAARYPSGYNVLSSDSHVGRRLFIGAATKAVIFFAWLGLCAILFGALNSVKEILATVGWAMCLVSVGLTLLALLDLWDFVHPAPVRGVCLSLTAILWGLYSFRDISKAIVALAVLVAVIYLVFAFWSWRRHMLSLLAVVCTICFLVAAAIAYEEWKNSGEAWKSPSDSAGKAAEFAKRLVTLDEWPHLDSGNPVIVVAASGGGSRAAVFASLALEALADRKIDCPPGDTLGKHLQAISSVSGGSLASASYIGALLKNPQKNVAGLHRDMAGDFLQPVLLGAIKPCQTRGKSLESHWATKFQLYHKLSEIAVEWRKSLGGAGPTLPLPLFNSATLDGHAVVITPFDWVSNFHDPAEGSAYAGNNEYQPYEQPTWVFYRQGVYSLEGLVPGYDPTLASAVRASANFPFGFPVVHVEAETRLIFSPKKEDRREGKKEHVRLTDGGVVSNSGMWTLFRLLKAHKDKLKERGVVLILVDATKMPEYGGRTRTIDLVQSILSRTHTAGNLHAIMIELIYALLDHRLVVVELAISPEKEHNIYTSWALDNAALQNLESEAEDRVKEMAEAASKGYCKLKAKEPVDTATLPRLPLD